MRDTVFWALALLVVAAPLAAQEPGSSRAAARCQQLLDEYQAAQKEALAESRAAQTDLERKRANEKFPQAVQYAPRFLEVARDAPGTAAALDALLWVATRAPQARPQVDEALAQLRRDHATSPRLGPVCRSLVGSASPAADGLLRKVLDENPSREVLAWACYALGLRLKERAEQAAGQKPAEADKFTAEAAKLLDRLVTRYPDVKSDGVRPADAARPVLFELRHLTVGNDVPEIEGRDVDGKKLRLSDQRGKVVVLVFWGQWCEPCRALLPQERALVKRLEGRPFVLLGVNSDPERGQVRAFARKEGITWRSWWDGGPTDGPIAGKWNVRTWPTVYVLDARGVIRARDVTGQGLDEAAIDVLVQDAERLPAKERPAGK
jgi:peroxiredoxin